MSTRPIRLVSKEATELAAELVAAGCDVRRTKKGHAMVWYAGRVVTVIPGTPSDWRSLKATRAACRRAGILV